MKLSLLFPCLLLLSIAACKKPTEAFNEIAISDPLISQVSVYDTLPYRSFSEVPINEINGVKVEYPYGRYTCYFEYDANPASILKAISLLPFDKHTSLADTQCRQVDFNSTLLEKDQLSKGELSSSYFFWEINPNDFTVYECLKSPMKHTILVSKTSNRIFHRIELAS